MEIFAAAPLQTHTTHRDESTQLIHRALQRDKKAHATLFDSQGVNLYLFNTHNTYFWPFNLKGFQFEMMMLLTMH
jgi:hypothetical protein